MTNYDWNNEKYWECRQELLSQEPDNEEDLGELSKEEYCKKYNISDEDYEMQVKWMQEM